MTNHVIPYLEVPLCVELCGDDSSGSNDSSSDGEDEEGGESDFMSIGSED